MTIIDRKSRSDWDGFFIALVYYIWLMKLLHTILFFIYVSIISIIFTYALWLLLAWVISLSTVWEIIVFVVVFLGIWKFFTGIMEHTLFWTVYKLKGFPLAMKAVIILWGIIMFSSFAIFPWFGSIQPDPTIIEKLIFTFLGWHLSTSFGLLYKIVDRKISISYKED